MKKVRRRKRPYKMPRYFSKMMNSPYFNSPHYEETKEFEIEKKIENYIDLTLYKFKIKRRKNEH